ncbi:MAG: RNA-binding protein [Clostridia bacterium]|nr:RNA-binding protein [Clostridia bacterium]
MERPVTIGSVVYSRAGRDEGNFFIVYGIVDDSYVLLVDGDIRKLDKPKKKKLKHVKNTGEVIQTLAEKILISAKIYDAEVYSALRKYNS